MYGVGVGEDNGDWFPSSIPLGDHDYSVVSKCPEDAMRPWSSQSQVPLPASGSIVGSHQNHTDFSAPDGCPLGPLQSHCVAVMPVT
jgi:hypothetical protein